METEKPVRLRIDNLSLSFGSVRALVDVSMDIRDNEILAIIGPNGAGKTALLNCISPAAVRGERLINVVKGRAEATGVPFEELMSKITANYSLKRPAE